MPQNGGWVVTHIIQDDFNIDYMLLLGRVFLGSFANPSIFFVNKLIITYDMVYWYQITIDLYQQLAR